MVVLAVVCRIDIGHSICSWTWISLSQQALKITASMIIHYCYCTLYYSSTVGKQGERGEAKLSTRQTRLETR